MSLYRAQLSAVGLPAVEFLFANGASFNMYISASCVLKQSTQKKPAKAGFFDIRLYTI